MALSLKTKSSSANDFDLHFRARVCHLHRHCTLTHVKLLVKSQAAKYIHDQGTLKLLFGSRVNSKNGSRMRISSDE